MWVRTKDMAIVIPIIMDMGMGMAMNRIKEKHFATE